MKPVTSFHRTVGNLRADVGYSTLAATQSPSAGEAAGYCLGTVSVTGAPVSGNTPRNENALASTTLPNTP